MSSLFDMMWAPNAAREDQARERAEAEELAYINAQKQAAGYGGAPAAAQGLSFDPTRIGRAEIQEDYDRLFNAPQQAPQQQQAPPQRGNLSDTFVNALINSGNPQAMQRGLNMREKMLMAPPSQPDIITGPGGRQWERGANRNHTPLFSDAIWESAQARAMAESMQEKQENPAEIIKLERDLRKDYLTDIKPSRAALNTGKRSFALLDDASAVGDYAGVIAFLKTLDPGSVVQNSESDAFKQAQGLYNTLVGNLNKMQGKGSLSPVQRDEMRRSIAAITNVWKDEHDMIRADAEDRIRSRGGYLNPQNIIGNPLDFGEFGSDEEAAPYTGGGSKRFEPDGAGELSMDGLPPLPPGFKLISR